MDDFLGFLVVMALAAAVWFLAMTAFTLFAGLIALVLLACVPGFIKGLLERQK